jgi:hypothetical protein
LYSEASEEVGDTGSEFGLEIIRIRFPVGSEEKLFWVPMLVGA